MLYLGSYVCFPDNSFILHPLGVERKPLSVTVDFAAERARLIQHLQNEITNQKVLDVMAGIPREMFIPEAVRSMAYEDRPLSIGYGQTISQPYIIALMTAALELTGTENVLELGTGSGYQAAILGQLARRVVTVERVPELADKTRVLLPSLGYTNIEIHLAGQQLGWPENAPYDAIIVTAAAPKVPPALLEQLGTGGRMVIPVGSVFEQDLLKVVKLKDKTVTSNLGGCRFVLLVGDGAWPEKDSRYGI